jgi:hypothetical protein
MPRSPRHFAAVAAAAVLLGPAGVLIAQGSPARPDVLRNPSLDSQQFSMLFPSRVHTAVKSSYDPDDRVSAPSQGNDDGFSGLNHSESYRIDDNGTPVSMLVDFEGRAGVLGLFFRNFWSDGGGIPLMPGENSRTRIWIDGTVRYDMPLTDYFRNPDDPRGQLAPFDGAFTRHRSGGHLTHAQLRWNQRFQIGLDDDAFANAARFHRVAATLASPEGELPVPDRVGWEWIAERPGVWPHHAVRTPQTTTLTVPAGNGRSAVVLTGPQTLLEVTVTVPNHADWTDLWARFTWDQAALPQVEMPLRLLGAMAAPPYRFPVASLLLNNDGDRRVTCYFPMHFVQQARLEIENRGALPVPVTLTYATVAGSHPKPWGYFTANYRAETTGTGETFQGPRLADCRGMLRFVMLEDNADTTGRIPDMHMTHLEGDLCVRINGNRGCDHNFDASETSIGRWGWYLTPADRPFVSDSSFNSSVMLRGLPGGAVEGHRVMGSTFVFDPVHFVDGIDMVLEHGVQNSSNADYAFLAFFYVEPGAARRTLAEIDIGNTSLLDPRSEVAHGVQFTAWSTYSRQGNFLRDQFFGTSPVADTVRHVRDFLRFRVRRPSDASNDGGIGLGFRLDRFGGPTLTRCQADVYVDGQRAALLHVPTHNGVFVWKEGGECEVELPRALTDGKASFTVELRPRPGSDPLKVARAWVYEYVK